MKLFLWNKMIGQSQKVEIKTFDPVMGEPKAEYVELIQSHCYEV